MAEIVIEPQGSIFKLKLTEDEMNTITELVVLYHSNYYDVVVGCFEIGLWHAVNNPKYPNPLTSQVELDV